MSERISSFPPPWMVEEERACFVVRDGHYKPLAHINFEERRSAANLLTRDEARRIASAILKLEDVLQN
jgi:hypothetical protein